MRKVPRSLLGLKSLLHRTSPRLYRGLSLIRSYATVGLRRPETVFSIIHRRNRWGAASSRSGTGSEMSQTAEVRRQLPSLLADLGVQRVLDLPCGDMEWISHIELGVETYIGGDIVPALIQTNGKTFAGGSRSFLTVDIVRGDLPKADLLLCRDCFVHLSLTDILTAVSNIRSSGITYLLTTTFVRRTENRDIPTGAWRPINLEEAPFNFPRAKRYIDEACTEAGGLFSDKNLALWLVADLPR